MDIESTATNSDFIYCFNGLLPFGRYLGFDAGDPIYDGPNATERLKHEFFTATMEVWRFAVYAQGRLSDVEFLETRLQQESFQCVMFSGHKIDFTHV